MLLNVLVHVKPPMLTEVLVELVLYTYTQFVSTLCQTKFRKVSILAIPAG